MKKSHSNWILFVGVILLFVSVLVILRLMPHAPNVAPIAATAIFAGLYLPRKWALVVPIAALLVSDLVIGFYAWPVMIAVYGSFIVTGLIGLVIRKKKNFATVLGGTVGASIIFFLVTNAAVWAFGTMYAPGFSGLMSSYIAAIPFFRNSLMGDILYVGALVGSMELVLARVRSSKRLRAKAVTA